jgi:hypothetical protein
MTSTAGPTTTAAPTTTLAPTTTATPINNIYMWEGDLTQPFSNCYWESREFVSPGRGRFSCARILLDTGDQDAYWQLVLDRQAIIDRNAAKLASGLLGTTGGDEGGYIFGAYPIAGDNLEDVPAEPSYGGTLTLQFKLYGDGVLKFTKQLYHNRIFKLPGGYRAQKWKVVLVGNVDKVQRVDIASSVQEIMRLQG